MSAAEMAKAIGRTGLCHGGKALRFAVIIEDAREVFGRLDYKVRPVEGQGSEWVSAERVKILEETEGSG